MIKDIKPDKLTAAYELVGGGIAVIEEELEYFDGQTPPSESAINTKLTELTAEYDARKYARDRKEDYDALNQFELMTDDAANSTTTHADAVTAVKTKWPKDNSGPV